MQIIELGLQDCHLIAVNPDLRRNSYPIPAWCPIEFMTHLIAVNPDLCMDRGITIQSQLGIQLNLNILDLVKCMLWSHLC
jgi:hypothetical protein